MDTEIGDVLSSTEVSSGAPLVNPFAWFIRNSKGTIWNNMPWKGGLKTFYVEIM